MEIFTAVLLLVLLTADIVASFMLQKTVSELSGSTSKLEFDIYGEIGIPNSTVRQRFCTLFTCFLSCTVCPMLYQTDL